MKMIRTPESNFIGLPGYPYRPNYVDVQGGRMHYVDEGSGEIILCLHGEPSWSYLYRKMIPILSKHYRVIAPDFFGFGQSDKFVRAKDYSFNMHYQTLIRFIEKTKLKDITLVVQDWGGLIGLSVLGKHPELFKRVVIMNTSLPIGNRKMPLAFRLWRAFAKYAPVFPIGKILQRGTYSKLDKATIAAYEAPFPDKRFKAGPRVWPSLVPMKSSDQGVRQMKRAREVLKTWNKPAFVLFSANDPITKGADKWFRKNIPTAKDEPEIIIQRAGHFLQEDQGKKIAEHIHEFIQRSLARERGEKVESE
ncbi:MAG: alpha/beta fold hydrolase [Flavobacteriales bacterium]|nr:alpha/beta fold hydrolase [Flavobacteriales bacterium]